MELSEEYTLSDCYISVEKFTLRLKMLLQFLHSPEITRVLSSE